MLSPFQKRGKVEITAYRCDEHDDTDHAGGKERGGVAAHTELIEDRGRVI